MFIVCLYNDDGDGDMVVEGLGIQKSLISLHTTLFKQWNVALRAALVAGNVLEWVRVPYMCHNSR